MATIAFLTDPPKWVVALASSLGTAVLAAVAAIWLSYSDFRAKRIKQNSAALEQTVQSTAELKPVLDRFIAAMNDKASLTQDDRAKLNGTIRQAYDRAEDVRNRLGGLDREFAALAGALVDLRDAGEKLVNSLNGGKQFFVSHSKWVVADENWRKAVQTRQNSYLSSLRL